MKKILLVEDDEHMSRMYKKLFTFGGFQVIVAEDGISGFQKAKDVNPDLIILDVMMPHMNGLELLEKIKNDSGMQSIPIVMLTNLDIQKDIDYALEKGAILYIIKNDHEPRKVFEMVKNLV
ncbi:MAG TPA: response regulator [Patescibacteria group bacterium]|nr:response regulator [Patescibacteria group bacterium]